MTQALFGSTRTVVGVRHALITPDGHVASALPDAKGVRIVYHITPAMGADFAQATLEFEMGGLFPAPANQRVERVFYVIEGEITIEIHGEPQRLKAGGFAYCPSGSDPLAKGALKSKVALFEKAFEFAGETPPPLPLVGNAADVPRVPFLGNPKAILQVLLPDTPTWDMAVNIFTYQPGATLPFVETHIMEHGLLMLAGQGIYRLEDEWYPVKAGDVIWMAPYCPQWFVAMGDEPASYLYYKDINRHPLSR